MRARRSRNADPNASTRVEILKSAAKAFRKLGYHGATVEQIAAALHMKKGNLYYYFKNKEEILFACHEYSLDKLLALMAEVESEPSSPEIKLRRLVLALIHLILDDLHGTALTLDPEALSPALFKRIIVKRDQFDHGIRTIIQQGIDQNAFRAGDPKMIEFAMMGAVNWIAKWFDPAGAMTSDQIGDAFADYLVGGLKK
jgi:TetR/AcrR family transcriptional regulator, cholesterol catabolism regulator